MDVLLYLSPLSLLLYGFGNFIFIDLLSLKWPANWNPGRFKNLDFFLKISTHNNSNESLVHLKKTPALNSVEKVLGTFGAFCYSFAPALFGYVMLHGQWGLLCLGLISRALSLCLKRRPGFLLTQYCFHQSHVIKHLLKPLLIILGQSCRSIEIDFFANCETWTWPERFFERTEYQLCLKRMFSLLKYSILTHFSPPLFEFFWYLQSLGFQIATGMRSIRLYYCKRVGVNSKHIPCFQSSL